jgi:hypothetical protein
MHMNPSAMDADGNGRRLAEGEEIGAVTNYLDFPNGTSYHLRFGGCSRATAGSGVNPMPP